MKYKIELGGIMAERRMFHTTVVESDAFLDLPAQTQALYFHLGMHADDNGFINSPKQICRKIHCSVVQLKKLIDTGFLLEYKGVVVLTHWRVANTLRKARLKPLQYPDFAEKLYIQDNGMYTFSADTGGKNLVEERMSIGRPLDDRRTPNRTEEKITEENRSEENRTEGKGREEKVNTAAAAAANDSGSNEKGIIQISQEQVCKLVETMGLDDFTYYVEKLANFIKEKDASVNDHCATILKWWKEDKRYG